MRPTGDPIELPEGCIKPLIAEEDKAVMTLKQPARHRKLRSFCRIAVAAACLVFGVTTFGQSEEEAARSLKILGAITSTGNEDANVALVKNKDSGVIKAIKVRGDVFGFGTLAGVVKQGRKNALLLELKSGKKVIIGDAIVGKQKWSPKGPSIMTAERVVEDGFLREGNKITVDKRYREDLLKNQLPTILMQAASEPVFGSDGRIQGFRLFELEDGSIFQKLGIQEADVITEINGFPLDNAVRTVQFLNSLRNEPNARVKVMRGGQQVELELTTKD